MASILTSSSMIFRTQPSRVRTRNSTPRSSIWSNLSTTSLIQCPLLRIIRTNPFARLRTVMERPAPAVASHNELEQSAFPRSPHVALALFGRFGGPQFNPAGKRARVHFQQADHDLGNVGGQQLPGRRRVLLAAPTEFGVDRTRHYIANTNIVVADLLHKGL